MLPTPLPQPAPYTCAHCGAGLQASAPQCPVCQQEMFPVQAGRVRSTLGATLACLFGIMVFGGIAGCSGLMIVAALSAPSPGQYPDMQGVFRGVLVVFISLLLLGLAGTAWCLWILIRGRRTA